MGNIYNATSSFNKHIQSLESGISADVGTHVCIYFEPNQFKEYPSILIRHLNPGAYNNISLEYGNIIECNIFVQQSQTEQAMLIMDSIYSRLGFTGNNLLNFVQVVKYDYTTQSNPTQCLEKMRLLGLNDGWRYISDPDEKIRHYQTDFELRYTL